MIRGPESHPDIHKEAERVQILHPRRKSSPEELGDSEPEGVADDQADGPQQEGGSEHTPDSPEQWAPLAPLWLQEGLCLRGPHSTESFAFKQLGVPGRKETRVWGLHDTQGLQQANKFPLFYYWYCCLRQDHSVALAGLELRAQLGPGEQVSTVGSLCLRGLLPGAFLP